MLFCVLVTNLLLNGYHHVINTHFFIEIHASRWSQFKKQLFFQHTQRIETIGGCLVVFLLLPLQSPSGF
jgi:hypothetical protein